MENKKELTNKMAETLCDKCVALCCRYFALPLDNPKTAADFDHIRWYLVHENVIIFVEDKQWYLGVLNRCKHLMDDNRCGIYEDRPRICRAPALRGHRPPDEFDTQRRL